MTTGHVEKFAELVGKDPALLRKLGLDKVNADAAAASASAVALNNYAVKEAKAPSLFIHHLTITYLFWLPRIKQPLEATF